MINKIFNKEIKKNVKRKQYKNNTNTKVFHYLYIYAICPVVFVDMANVIIKQQPPNKCQ